LRALILVTAIIPDECPHHGKIDIFCRCLRGRYRKNDGNT